MWAKYFCQPEIEQELTVTRLFLFFHSNGKKIWLHFKSVSDTSMKSAAYCNSTSRTTKPEAMICLVSIASGQQI